MDAKFEKRFESYKKSLLALAEARGRDMADSFVLSGTAAKFSISFELAWKVMKDVLIQHYVITDFVSGSPKEVLKRAFSANLISDDTWLAMLSVRNDLAHDYDGEVIKKWCEEIIGKYIDLMEEFRDNVERLLTE